MGVCNEMERTVLLFAVGDVHIDRVGDPQTPLALAAEVLNSSDILFGNNEGVYTDRPVTPPSAGIPVVSGLSNARGIEQVRFDVFNCANNHSVDGGHVGLLDNLEALRGRGIATVGTGADLAEARRPAIVERNGTRIGFIAFASDYGAGYNARATVPGLNPLRVHTHHCQAEGEHSLPGGAPRTLTFAYREDVEFLQQAIADLRRLVDVVVVSFHWGEGIQPFVLMDYERDTARRAIDFGADAVICHHHHTLRGVDFYRGQPIFHGICHFVPDYPHIERDVPPEMMSAIAAAYGEYAIQVHADYPLLPMHPNCRNTMIAAIRFVDGKIAEVGAVPCRINPKGQPHPVELETAEGRGWLGFFREVSEKSGMTAAVETGQIAGHDALIFQPA